ncbi:unnamed protein product [Somion occarium]|uniref:Uncharacterized protein n=1 Tax=Somion occarium TaxID=3059160 RepID=A0ABP1CND7_9APHY
MSHLEKAETGTVGATPPRQALGGARAPKRLANPGPLGLWSFASTTLILSLFNLQARGINTPNIVVGMALFCGGLAQFLAAFTSYGAFWMSFATIYIPNSGILAAYEGSPTELASAVGIYLMAWFTVTFLLFIAALRRSVGLCFLFGFLTITFMLLGIGEFQASVATTKAGGAMGIATALIAYYCGMAQLLTREDSWFTLPLGEIPKRLD